MGLRFRFSKTLATTTGAKIHPQKANKLEKETKIIHKIHLALEIPKFFLPIIYWHSNRLIKNKLIRNNIND